MGGKVRERNANVLGMSVKKGMYRKRYELME